MHRKIDKNQLRQSVPKSSFITEMCYNSKNLNSWYNMQWPFLLQICFIMLKPKQISRHKYCICKEGCIHTCTYILQTSLQVHEAVVLFM